MLDRETAASTRDVGWSALLGYSFSGSRDCGRRNWPEQGNRLAGLMRTCGEHWGWSRPAAMPGIRSLIGSG